MMNRVFQLAIVAVAMMAVGCQSRTQEFKAADGSVVATVKKGTNDWRITNAEGNDVVGNYDSMRVVEVSEDGHPMTVVYYTGNEQRWMQYFSTMRLRSDGTMVDGLREGRWVFYHANGAVQCEATFVGGREEGPYRVYRDNGAPYYIGQYSNGKPAGIWEIYDMQGNLVEKKEY